MRGRAGSIQIERFVYLLRLWRVVVYLSMLYAYHSASKLISPSVIVEKAFIHVGTHNEHSH